MGCLIDSDSCGDFFECYCENATDLEGCEQSKNDEARSTIEWKYQKMEGCEQSKNDEARSTIEWKYQKMEGCEQSKNDEVMIFPCTSFPQSQI